MNELFKESHERTYVLKEFNGTVTGFIGASTPSSTSSVYGQGKTGATNTESLMTIMHNLKKHCNALLAPRNPDQITYRCLKLIEKQLERGNSNVSIFWSIGEVY